MAAEDVARIYMTLDDRDDYRRAIAHGDFAGVDGDLTDAEKKMLMDAATEEVPDVTGFSLEADQQVTWWAPYRFATEQYVTRYTADPTIQAQFLSWQNAAGVNPDG